MRTRRARKNVFVTKSTSVGRTLLLRGVWAGMGVTLALPLLDSMVPALTPLAKAAALPKSPRFVGIIDPHGWAPDYGN